MFLVDIKGISRGNTTTMRIVNYILYSMYMVYIYHRFIIIVYTVKNTTTYDLRYMKEGATFLFFSSFPFFNILKLYYMRNVLQGRVLRIGGFGGDPRSPGERIFCGRVEN